MLARGSDWKLNLQKGVRAIVLSFAGSGRLPGASRVVLPSVAPRLDVAKAGEQRRLLK